MKTDMERKAREIRNFLEIAAHEAGMESDDISSADELFNDPGFCEDMMGDKIYDECVSKGEWNKEKTIELVEALEKIGHFGIKTAMQNFRIRYPEIFGE